MFQYFVICISFLFSVCVLIAYYINIGKKLIIIVFIIILLACTIHASQYDSLIWMQTKPLLTIYPRMSPRLNEK